MVLDDTQIPPTIGLRSNPQIRVSDVMVQGDEVILALEGQIKYDAAEMLRKYLVEIYEQNRPCRLVLDCRNLRFMDSQGLAMLIQFNKACMADGNSIVLQQPSANLQGLFKITRIDQVIAIR